MIVVQTSFRISLRVGALSTIPEWAQNSLSGPNLIDIVVGARSKLMSKYEVGTRVVFPVGLRFTIERYFDYFLGYFYKGLYLVID